MRILKKNLILKEHNVNQTVLNQSKNASANPNGESTTSLSSYSNTNTDDGINIDVNANDNNAMNTVEKIANSGMARGVNASVTVHKESKKSRPIVEGVHFTKQELSDFLLSL